MGTSVTGSPTVLYEKRDDIAWVTLNRPERMNAFNPELSTALGKAFQEASRDLEVMVVVLTGAGGRAFCAGNDLKEAAQRYDSGVAPGTEQMGIGGMDAVAQCPKPVIAAIDGYAVAGGMEIAMACDIRLATEQSRFGLPEIKRGRTAGPGLTMLGRMIPMGEARWIQLTGAHMSAKRAYEVGFIQALLPDRDALFAEVERVADEMKVNAPLSTEATKRVIQMAPYLSPEHAQQYWRAERALIDKTEDIVEGAKAFAEKRRPQWKRR